MILRELLYKLGFDYDPKGERRAEQGVQRIKGATGQASSGVQSLAGAVKGWMGAIAVGAAALVGGRALVETIANYESLKTALITVTGSAENADAAFAKIRKFAAKTPYQVDQVTQAYLKLSALGLDPSEEALTSYGNTASAMGKDLMQMIEAVADASTMEFERLKEFGIKARQKGNNVSFTFRGVTTTVKKDAKAIQDYLLGIGNVQFAGGMERQSKTLKGIWSTLKDGIATFAYEVGQAGLLDALHDLLQVFGELGGGTGSLAKGLGFVLSNAVRGISMALRALNRIIRPVVQAIKNLIPQDVLDGTSEFVTQLKQVAKVAALIFFPVFGLLLLLEDFVAFLQGRDSVIGRFVEQFKTVDGPLGDFARFLANVADPAWWEQMAQSAKAFFQPVMDWVTKVIDTFTELKDQATEVLDHIGDRITEMVQPFMGLIEAVIRFGTALYDLLDAMGVFDALNAYMDQMMVGAKIAFGVLATVGLWAFDQIMGVITRVVDAFTKALNWFSGLMEDWTEIFKSFSANVRLVWDQLLEWLVGMVNGVIDIINGIIEVANDAGLDIEKLERVSIAGNAIVDDAKRGRAPDWMSGYSETNRKISQKNDVTVNLNGINPRASAAEIQRAVAGGVKQGTSWDNLVDRAYAGATK